MITTPLCRYDTRCDAAYSGLIGVQLELRVPTVYIADCLLLHQITSLSDLSCFHGFVFMQSARGRTALLTSRTSFSAMSLNANEICRQAQREASVPIPDRMVEVSAQAGLTCSSCPGLASSKSSVSRVIISTPRAKLSACSLALIVRQGSVSTISSRRQSSCAYSYRFRYTRLTLKWSGGADCPVGRSRLSQISGATRAVAACTRDQHL